MAVPGPTAAPAADAAGTSARQQAAGGGRAYLFLQGPIGPFFSRLASRLQAAGARVHRINFNGGDRLFWRLPGAADFKGGAAQWPGFLGARLAQWRITDLVLFGDCRPLHRQAIALARARGIPAHVFEEGYLRPDWITLERGGVNRHSALPRDPAWFRATAAALPPWREGLPVRPRFARRALEDVLYNLASALCGRLYPGYRTHKPWHPLVEYAAGARRMPLQPWARKRAAAAIRRIQAQRRPYYLFPLQLDADTQIRHHSPLGRMAPAIEQVIDSFARHAPAEAGLVLTEHPLEVGVIDLRRVCARRAAAAGVAARVSYLPGGTPDALLRGSRGMVTVNSTLGLAALQAGIPLIALGDAIYQMPGLAFQGGLDAFWNAAPAPEADLVEAFRRVTAQRTQINGGYYSALGRSLAVAGAAARLGGPRPGTEGSDFSGAAVPQGRS